MKKRKDQKFLDWLSYQPSWLDGAFSETDRAGHQRNIACHVRRASNAGTGYKPLYSALPMTNMQHLLETNKGKLACIMAYTNYQRFLAPYDGTTLVEKAKAAFDAAAVFYVEKWRMLNAKIS